MIKLDRWSYAIIILSCWGASFLAATMFTNDYARALGATSWFLLLGWAAAGSVNRRLAKRSPSPPPAR